MGETGALTVDTGAGLCIRASGQWKEVDVITEDEAARIETDFVAEPDNPQMVYRDLPASEPRCIICKHPKSLCQCHQIEELSELFPPETIGIDLASRPDRQVTQKITATTGTIDDIEISTTEPAREPSPEFHSQTSSTTPVRNAPTAKVFAEETDIDRIIGWIKGPAPRDGHVYYTILKGQVGYLLAISLALPSNSENPNPIEVAWTHIQGFGIDLMTGKADPNRSVPITQQSFYEVKCYQLAIFPSVPDELFVERKENESA